MSKSFAVPQFAKYHVLSARGRKALGGTVAVGVLKFRFAWVARLALKFIGQVQNQNLSLIHARVSGSSLFVAVERAHMPG